jgi:hypothetical protein
MSNYCKTYLNSLAHFDCIAHVSARLLGVPVHFGQSKSGEFTVATVPSLSYRPSAQNNKGLPGIIEISMAYTEDTWTKDEKYFYEKYEKEAFHINIHVETNSKGQLLFYNRATPVMQALAHKLVDVFGGTMYADENDFDRKIITHEVQTGSFLPFYIDDENEGFVARHAFYQNLHAIPSSLIRHYQTISPYPYEPDELHNKLYRFVDIEYQRLHHSVNEKNGPALDNPEKIKLPKI